VWPRWRKPLRPPNERDSLDARIKLKSPLGRTSKMSDNESVSKKTGDMRKRAEERTSGKAERMVENLEALTKGDTKRLLHELRVYQIELETQNEELRLSQEELESSRARYFDLYNLAPVGYLTISKDGLILQAILPQQNMLGVSRSDLMGYPLSYFIFPEDQDVYYNQRKKTL